MKKLILLCVGIFVLSSVSFALTAEEGYVDSYITNALSKYSEEKKTSILKNAESKLESLVSLLPLEDKKRPILKLILNVVKFQLQGINSNANISIEATVVEVVENGSNQASENSDQKMSSLLTSTQNELFVLMNQIRQDNNLQPLKVSSTLQLIAENHVSEMDEHNYFNHTNLAGDDSVARVEKSGYKFSYVGETLAYNADTADVVAYGWLGSTLGHREILLNPKATEVGIGNAAGKGIWTAVYASPINFDVPQ